MKWPGGLAATSTSGLNPLKAGNSLENQRKGDSRPQELPLEKAVADRNCLHFTAPTRYGGAVCRRQSRPHRRSSRCERNDAIHRASIDQVRNSTNLILQHPQAARWAGLGGDRNRCPAIQFPNLLNSQLAWSTHL